MISGKIFENINAFKDQLKEYKSSGRKLIFTNGCFDLLHKGHVLYLEEAKSLGDILIVGLNSDASIKRLKGNSRPIKNIVDRSFVLASLGSVDAVVVFEDDTPLLLVQEIIPDVIVKGGDWKPEQIIGSDVVLNNGGEVKSLQFIENHSTTKIVENLKGK